MKSQEGYVLKYLNFLIYQSPLGFSVDKIYHIMELVNKWFPTGNFIKVDNFLRKDSTYDKELMAALPLTGNPLRKSETEYNKKFVHTLGRIKHTTLMSRIGYLIKLVV